MPGFPFHLALMSLFWAAPFVAAGWLLMTRAQRRGGLTAGRWFGIAAGMLAPLWLVGGGVCLLYLSSLPGPDAGLAASVGTAFGGVGATIVWVLAAIVGFAVLRRGARRSSRP